MVSCDRSICAEGSLFTMPKIVAINVAVLAALMLLIEVIFGNWIFESQIDRLNIPRDMKIEYTVDIPGLPAWDVVYERDALGLRGPYDTLSDIDILTVGGSTTDQRLLSEPDTWQGNMRRMFERAGKDVVIVNAAVDGQSTRGHIAAFEGWLSHLPDLRARFVLAYVGINDFNLSPDNVYDKMYQDDVRAAFDIRRLIADKSALYYLYRTVRGMIEAEKYDIRHSAVRPTGAWQPLSETPAVDVAAESLASYRQRITVLARRIDDLGAKPIFVTQPIATATWRDGQVYVRAGDGVRETYLRLRAFNRALMATCAELDAICIDLARELTFDDDDFYDLVHNTPQGAARIGAFLFEKLKSNTLGD